MKMQPKRKWWKVHRNDVGRELADPDWAEWAGQEIERLQEDVKRLDWLLANMNQKGFDDKACGIVSRGDIDYAISEQNAEADTRHSQNSTNK